MKCRKFVLIYFNSLGPFSIELYWNHAPLSCRNFAELSRCGYYNGVKFHKCIPNFIIQSGDPTDSGGRGGTSIYGPSFKDEIHSELKHSGAGIIAMANSGPNKNNRYLKLLYLIELNIKTFNFSQFYITLAPCQHLDGKYTIFGRVLSGLKVIDRIGNVQTDDNDIPIEDVRIISASVCE